MMAGLLSVCRFIVSTFSFKTPLTESIRMAALADKVYDACAQARTAWTQAGATITRAKELIENKGDPDEISRLNLSVLCWEREGEHAYKQAVRYRQELYKVASDCRFWFGDIDASELALHRAAKWVAKVESLEEEVQAFVKKRQEGMGTLTV
jgi:hypothetical protein